MSAPTAVPHVNRSVSPLTPRESCRRQRGGCRSAAANCPSRPLSTRSKGSSRYFASELPGYYDEYDEYVYEWARSRFVRDVQNLSGWRCAMERWEDGDRLACAE